MNIGIYLAGVFVGFVIGAILVVVLGEDDD